jgi:LysM repeat protein
MGEVGVARRAPVRGGIRLTRRGRLVVLGFLLTLAALVVALAAPATQAADPSGEAPVAVVHAGDTLWSVAERHAPGAERFATIEEIRRLNGLPDYTVHVGQRLRLPRSR